MIHAVVLALVVLTQSPRMTPALDLEFTAAVESSVGPITYLRLPPTYRALIDGLDADRHRERAEAARRLYAACSLDPAGQHWLLRARLVDRRPEVRYWLNRILRDLNRCEACDGNGYCAQYRPDSTAIRPEYCGIPCSRCHRQEWQHGDCFLDGGGYGRYPCESCEGSGTNWNHYGVD